MNKWDEKLSIKIQEHQYITLSHEEDKLIIYEKGDLVFIFNFHTTKSFENFEIGTKWREDLFTLFDTDSKDFSGQGRLDQSYGKPFVPTL